MLELLLLLFHVGPKGNYPLSPMTLIVYSCKTSLYFLWTIGLIRVWSFANCNWYKSLGRNLKRQNQKNKIPTGKKKKNLLVLPLFPWSVFRLFFLIIIIIISLSLSVRIQKVKFFLSLSFSLPISLCKYDTYWWQNINFFSSLSLFLLCVCSRSCRTFLNTSSLVSLQKAKNNRTKYLHKAITLQCIIHSLRAVGAFFVRILLME